MKPSSFSQKTKQFLKELPNRKKCCQHTLEEALALPDDPGGAGKLGGITAGFRCPGCPACLIRGLFIRFGSVTSPEKQYHLDFSFHDPALADAVEIFLDENGIPPKRTVRKGRLIAYYKESSQIEDLLALIGATGAAFDVMNGKIVKDMRNSVNRQVNCDTHNIQVALNAAAEQLRALSWLEEHGKLDTLAPECRETARLRLDNPQVSLTELGQMHDPIITKSGVNHRLQKIMAKAAELKEQENN